ncbi:aminotransferase class I/II-fold pyridoxal phosphate-dependent enzyme [Peribacillus deserti]|uniref:Arginine decarboxylase n=1 Tax=Peribacillus deserti TaxID=673318 RepID=A0A2N5M081_9BACI|nr:aminotransferase class I/II-fold pyridoxal phosphate-dependent enzyme [Peribacillus deserti]PLT27776.1 arginine decarboxylase [Peribacillus deserti]
MNQYSFPLFQALLEHHRKDPVSFHVPGHKYGRVFPEEGMDFYQSILRIDATELSGLDDLHAPEGPIEEAQKLLSLLYGSRESYFLVNGTTSGNMAMILAACCDGDLVLVQRNCHKSILHALRIANARPIFISPEFNDIFNVAAGITAENIEEVLKIHPNPKALILTYPNYYGEGKDIDRIIELCHRHGIAVLVDQAHGAHFVLGEPFPKCAVAAGADVVVQSAHKTLPAMTMGSYLHFKSDIIDKSRLRFYLQMFQSSSPSYPIMASLDLARHYAASYSSEELERLVSVLNSLKSDINNIDGVRVLEHDHIDPLKITIRSTRGVPGYILQEGLEKQRIFAELADPYNVLFVAPLSSDTLTRQYEKVLKGIRKGIKDIRKEHKISSIHTSWISETAGLEISFKQMEVLERKELLIEESAGMIAAESIIPYPPGIPLFLQGERITEERISILKSYQALGARFHGGECLSENKIKVFKET